MVGDMGHKGGLINPRPGRGKCRAGFSNTGGSPLPRWRAPKINEGTLKDIEICTKNENNILKHQLTHFLTQRERWRKLVSKKLVAISH